MVPVFLDQVRFADFHAWPCRPVQQTFDPNEWCDGNDAIECDEDGTELWLDEQLQQQQERSSEMQWERLSLQQQQLTHVERQRHDLPSHIVPAFLDRPPAEQSDGLFGARFDAAVDQQLDRHAMGNLLQSISRSRRMGITEEIGLADPYHETDDSMGRGVAAVQQRLGPDGAPLLLPAGGGDNEALNAGDALTAHVIRSDGERCLGQGLSWLQ